MSNDPVHTSTSRQKCQKAAARGRRRLVAGLAVVSVAAVAAWMGAGEAEAPQHRVLDLTARSYAFEPAVLRVSEGDRVTLRLRSSDVVHGFHLDGHDIDATVYPLRREFELRTDGIRQTVESVTFTASRPGKYRYRCSVTCGPMHPFMVGELIVEPNRLWPGAAAAALALFATAALVVSRGARGCHAP
jgi:heme/copper-type cytochrome/quinol oxidase subunit 2